MKPILNATVLRRFDSLRATEQGPQDILLVASSGGHLLQLLQLANIRGSSERSWITFQRSDAQSLLASERIIWAYHPTNRNVKNTLRNLLLAYRVLRRQRPKAIITTGAGVAVPFAVVGKLMRINVIYVESMARITKPSLTGRLLYPIATHFFVQWPELLRFFPRAEYHGTVFDLS